MVVAGGFGIGVSPVRGGMFVERAPPMPAKPRRGGMFIEPTPRRHVQSRRDGMFIEPRPNDRPAP